MSELVNRDGVHASHCCAKCGCKYGDPDCPVVKMRLPARYACEWCDRERDDDPLVNELRAKVEALEAENARLREELEQLRFKLGPAHRPGW